MADEIIKHDPKPFRPGGFKPTGLNAIKERAIQEEIKSGKEPVVRPEELPNRIGIVFDDSGSMEFQQREDAKAGCEEFLRSCKAGETAVAVMPLCSEPIPLCENLPAVAILIKGIDKSGSTPIIPRLTKICTENNLTRVIVFSDGAPNAFTPESYEHAIKFRIPVDTVYIPSTYVDERAVTFMKKLADDTGGIYLQFEHGKSNFRTAFKYLSPGLRYMLTDKSFKDKLEGK